MMQQNIKETTNQSAVLYPVSFRNGKKNCAYCNVFIHAKGHAHHQQLCDQNPDKRKHNLPSYKRTRAQSQTIDDFDTTIDSSSHVHVLPDPYF